MRLTFEDLDRRYSEMTSRVIVKCQAVTPLVGGVTASETGVRAFIKHHLGITDEAEAQQAFERINREELGERDIAPETGELKEHLTYGINVIRRTQIGPYLGNWMIHANIKTAMSRLSMFADMKGTKGNVVEGGIVRPYGISKRDERPDCVYLVDSNGEPATTYFDEFKGRVSSPKGAVSVIHHSECVPAGTLFEYEFAFLRGKLTDADITDWLALSMIVGFGSVKSLGHGKVRILEAEILAAADARKKAEKAKKGEPVEAV
jgi:hypothetical protein